MAWVLEHLQLLIGIAAAIAYYLNRARQEKAEAQSPREETEEARAERTRRLQEEIRRKIAERRGGGAAPAAAPVGRGRDVVPPLVRTEPVRPIDPFGGPVGRVLREVREAAEKEFDPAVEERRRAEEAAAHQAVLARQEKLAEEMRALEAARVVEQKRVAAILAQRRELRSDAVTRGTDEASLTGALRDPRELRRAFVLREVLGAPVALR